MWTNGWRGGRGGSLRRTRGLLALLVGLLTISSVAAATRGQTTVGQTILDVDRDNRLETAPGETHLVRSELAPALAGRERRRVPQLFFAQLSDMHLIDEESPLRVEFSDAFGPPLTSAYRPQEGLTPQVLNEMVRQVRATVSPITRRSLELVMTTGDNSDNTQLNETRWFIDLFDGGVTLDPNSGIPGSCGTANTGRRYDGVRGGSTYYEPDRSGPPGAASVDGSGYAPDQAENEQEAGRSNAVRDFPGLFEAMNRPFKTAGLHVPWYGIFGNHDGLILGNQPRNEALEAFAVGCLKVDRLAPATVVALQTLLAGGVTPDEQGQIYRLLTDDMLRTAADPLRAAELARIVPQDPQRRPLTKREYIEQHFVTRGAPVGHGFTAANLASGQGNYAFSPRRGLRFIVLDSINENGLADGNIDDTQFRWLHEQLLAAEGRRELALVFAHHSLRTMNQPPVSPFPPGDQGGDPSPLVHFGLGPGNQPAPCLLSDPALPPTPDETLHCLFLRHRSLIAFVAGHEHTNRVVAYPRHNAAGSADGGFWEITTAAHIDWPQQSRVIDLVDNRDGTLSLFGTIIDHSAAPRPGATLPSGSSLSRDDVSLLAAISRELSYNDPQADNGEDGRADARGTRADRNVELLVKHPYRR